MIGDIWYRFEDRPGSDGVLIFINKFTVTKTTPKGLWLTDGYQRRFVLNDAHKKFACPNPLLAYESFVARKTRQAKILRARLRQAENAIDAAKTEMNKEIYKAPLKLPPPYAADDLEQIIRGY